MSIDCQIRRIVGTNLWFFLFLRDQFLWKAVFETSNSIVKFMKKSRVNFTVSSVKKRVDVEGEFYALKGTYFTFDWGYYHLK